MSTISKSSLFSLFSALRGLKAEKSCILLFLDIIISWCETWTLDTVKDNLVP